MHRRWVGSGARGAAGTGASAPLAERHADLTEYAPAVMAVFDVDFGHTDPQIVIPYGGTVVVDGPARQITVHY